MRVLLFRGTGIISRLILWQTRGKYSHAAIFHNGELWEAREFKGVQKLKGLELKPGETVDHYDVRATKEQAHKILSFLEKQLNKKYDYRMVARFITRQQESRKTTGKWFCSELVFAAFQKAGISLLERTEPWEVSPKLLCRSPKMKHLHKTAPDSRRRSGRRK